MQVVLNWIHRVSALLLLMCLLSACSSPSGQRPIYGAYVFPDLKPSFSYVATGKKIAAFRGARPFYVLAIDGGGMAGVIPLHVLMYLEKETGRPISQLFDLVVGTSTGALIAGTLTMPGSDGSPMYTAADVDNLYDVFGRRIFRNTFSHRLASLWGLTGPVFPRDHIDSVMKTFLYDSLLSQSLTHLVVLESSYQLHDIFYFDSELAKKQKNNDFILRSAIESATATPFIFSPHYYCNLTRTFCDKGFDAAVVINNPVLVAYYKALSLAGNRPIVLVSLGDGFSPALSNYQIQYEVDGWGAIHLSSILGAGQNSINRWPIHFIRHKSILGPHVSAYFRFNILAKHENIFDPSKKNMKKLNRLGALLVSRQKKRLNQLVHLW